MTTSPRPGPDRTRPPTADSIHPYHLPEVVEERLPSGLELRLIPVSRVPLVSACLVLDAGESEVELDQAGLAVLAGDALQGGTDRRSGAELARALEGLGTSLRVSTGWDSTTLSFTCTAERLEPVLELLAEVVREPAFPPDEVDRFRRQRLAAIRQRRMDPAAAADDEADRVLFPAGHPCHRPLAGTPATVEALGAGDAAGWVEARYRPGGGGLVLAGDLDGDGTARLVERHFPGWVGTPEASRELPPVRLARPRPVVLAHRNGAVQAQIRVVLPAPPRAHADRIPLQVANAVFGGAFTSRLNLNLRERHGFTYGARSYFVHRRRDGAFRVTTAVDTDVTAAALREAMSELERFHAEGPTEDEVLRARDYLAGIFPLRMETTAQLAARFSALLVHRLPSDEHHRYRERVRSVTRDEVVEAFRRHVDPALAPVVLLGDADRVRAEVEALGLGPVEVRETAGPVEEG